MAENIYVGNGGCFSYACKRLVCVAAVLLSLGCLLTPSHLRVCRSMQLVQSTEFHRKKYNTADVLDWIPSEREFLRRIKQGNIHVEHLRLGRRFVFYDGGKPIALAKLTTCTGDGRHRKNPEWADIVASRISEAYLGYPFLKDYGFYMRDISKYLTNPETLVKKAINFPIKPSNSSVIAIGGTVLPYNSKIISHQHLYVVDACAVQKDNPFETALEYILDNLLGIIDRSCRKNVFFDPGTGKKILLDFDSFPCTTSFCTVEDGFPMLQHPSFLDPDRTHNPPEERPKAKKSDRFYCSILFRSWEMMNQSMINFEERTRTFTSLLNDDEWFAHVLPNLSPRTANQCGEPTSTKEYTLCFLKEALYLRTLEEACLPDRCLDDDLQATVVCMIREIISHRFIQLHKSMESQYKCLCSPRNNE